MIRPALGAYKADLELVPLALADGDFGGSDAGSEIDVSKYESVRVKPPAYWLAKLSVVDVYQGISFTKQMGFARGCVTRCADSKDATESIEVTRIHVLQKL